MGPARLVEEPPTREALRSLPCIGLSAVETWEIGGRPVRVEPVLVVNDLEVACAAAVAGVGLARLPALACRKAIDDGRLRVCFAADKKKTLVYVVAPSRDLVPAKVTTFVDLLAGVAADVA